MGADNLNNSLKELTFHGLSAITASSFGLQSCKRAIAYYDTRKDDLITTTKSFQPTADALSQLPAVQSLFGAAEARRIAIQFVFNVCGRVADGSPAEIAFEQVWDSFLQEMDTTTWTY